MNDVWLTIAVLAVVTAAIRGAGSLVIHRPPSPRALGVITLLGPVVIAALVAYQTFAGPNGGLQLDARIAGVAAAASAVAARWPISAVVLVAAAVTAGVRAL